MRETERRMREEEKEPMLESVCVRMLVCVCERER